MKMVLFICGWHTFSFRFKWDDKIIIVHEPKDSHIIITSNKMSQI